MFERNCWAYALNKAGITKEAYISPPSEQELAEKYQLVRTTFKDASTIACLHEHDSFLPFIHVLYMLDHESGLISHLPFYRGGEVEEATVSEVISNYQQFAPEVGFLSIHYFRQMY